MDALLTPTQAIQEILEWTRTRYTHPNGGVSRTVTQDGQPSKGRLFNDLGDYLPFFSFLGETTFCSQQLEDTYRFLTEDSLLPSEFQYFGLSCVRSYEHTDLLLGLIDAYQTIPSEKLKETIFRIADRLRELFHPKNGYRSSWYFPRIHLRFPVLDFKDGMLIEIWTLLYKTFHEPRFLEAAEELAQTVLEISQKKGLSLVPNVVGTTFIGRMFVWAYFRNERTFYTSMKYNSNTLYAFLELYRLTGKESYRTYLIKASEAIRTTLCDANGAVHIAEYQEPHCRLLPETFLVQSFPLMDWAADCAFFLKEPAFLTLAKQIAHPWMGAQDPNTGLIPQELGGHTTDLDTLTDTSIAFYKIYNLTKDDSYKKAADRLIEGILRYHRQPLSDGYALGVNSHTGAVTDPHIKIKFICLFLKALICYERSDALFEPRLYELTKDR
jgi:hypothetical protein